MYIMYISKFLTSSTNTHKYVRVHIYIDDVIASCTSRTVIHPERERERGIYRSMRHR